MSREALAVWLDGLPASEKEQVVTDWLEGERAEIANALRGRFSASRPPRTIGELSESQVRCRSSQPEGSSNHYPSVP